MPDFLTLDDISKHFAGVQALDGLSLSIDAGEIHCLAGENGSGKSTVIKVMSGVYKPDRGTIALDGRIIPPFDPISAIHAGIQVIYQDFSLFGNLTVAENVALGAELGEGRHLVNWRRVRRITETALQRLGVDLDPDADVDDLPTAGRQLVAIARAMTAGPRLLIMDEPTTALTRREIDSLFTVVNEIRRSGVAVLFVSHKMREMLEISDRITVIRNGRKVAEGPTASFNEAAITRAMTGQEFSDTLYRAPEGGFAGQPPRLSVKRLTLPGQFEDLVLDIRRGEIVGLTGLLGSGRTQLARALFGLEAATVGDIRVDGVAVRVKRPGDAISAGIAYVPEDRLTEGLFLGQSINRNILASIYNRIAPHLVVDRVEAGRRASDMIAAMRIATPTGAKPVGQLSGGNQQRVVIGRWLLTDARVLLLNGPTVGVDVGSKAEIHRIVRALASEKGLAVLMISDDLPELVQNCSRIIVMHRGRFVADMATGETSEHEISDMLTSLR
jgi:simple sugar transport system ATP-binding protein